MVKCMMFSTSSMLVFVAAYLSLPCFASRDVFGRAADVSLTPPPNCALPCISPDIMLKYCAATNVTCTCTNTDLIAEIRTCAAQACDIAENFALVRFSDEVCGRSNDLSRRNAGVQVTAAYIPLVTLFLAVRLFVRLKTEAGLWADDYLMIGAFIFYLASVSMELVLLDTGFGQHTWYFSTPMFSDAVKWLFITGLLYVPVITLTKLSILSFFRRIFPHRRIRAASLYFGLFIIISNTALFLTILLECLPISGNWTFNVVPGAKAAKCLNPCIILQVVIGFSILHDVIIMVLPMRTLWNLSLHWKKKLNVLAMFLLGFFVIICSALSMSSINEPTSGSDFSWENGHIPLFTVIEISTGIICGCLPAFRSFIGWRFPQFKMTVNDHSSNSTSHSAANVQSNKPLHDNHKHHRASLELGEDDTHSSNSDANAVSGDDEAIGERVGTMDSMCIEKHTGHEI